MATQITANLPTLNFPREVDYPTQEDWAAFSAAAELNFGILGSGWSTQMQLWKAQANAMSIESNNNANLAQSIANYQGDWTSQGYTLGQSVSVSGIYYICKLTHATGQNPTTGGSIYWNLALGNWSLKVALADFTGTNVNLAKNGYQKLPSGLIIQWGYNNNWNSPVREVGVPFPIAFPNAFLSGFITTVNDTVVTDNGGSIYAYNNSGMAVTLNNVYSFHWFAIGY